MIDRVHRLSEEDITCYEKDILNLFIQAQEISFSKSKIEEVQVKNRVKSLKDYVENSSAVVYGAYEEETLIGIVWLYLKSDKVVHLNSFVIDDQYRGTGIGSLLWAKVENFMEESSFEELELLVTADNIRGINFYEKKSFEIERLIMRKRFS